MRIIRGEFAGKPLITPSTSLTRPTSDKVRQAIFNIIEHHSDMVDLRQAYVLDIFAGTGALGLEALSRGAKHVTFVDNQRTAILNLYNIARDWNIKPRIEILAEDALRLGNSNRPMDFIFCDPPYKKDLVNFSLNHLHATGWIGENTTIVAEMHKQDDINVSFSINILQEKRYGDTKVIFFKTSSVEIDLN